jgi:hypothetical protein
MELEWAVGRPLVADRARTEATFLTSNGDRCLRIDSVTPRASANLLDNRVHGSTIRCMWTINRWFEEHPTRSVLLTFLMVNVAFFGVALLLYWLDPSLGVSDR